MPLDAASTTPNSAERPEKFAPPVPLAPTESPSPAGPSDPQSDRRAERRLGMIPTAARMFAQIGYADCEMGRVASELGIAKGTLYLYFASKEELFYACVDHGMRCMQAQVQAAAEASSDPLERISGAIRAYLAFFADHPEHVELLIQERANFKNRPQPTYFQYRAAMRGPWRDLYADLIRQGRLRDDLPVERILDLIGHLVYGTMFTNHFAGSTASLAEQHRAILEIVMRGVLSDQERELWTYVAMQGDRCRSDRK